MMYERNGTTGDGIILYTEVYCYECNIFVFVSLMYSSKTVKK